MDHQIYHMNLTIKLLLSILLVAGATSQLYYCNVDNCEACSYDGFCGVCQNNYRIYMNSTTGMPFCSPLECTMGNCLTCLQDNICQICEDGYYLQADGTCTMTASNTNCSDNCLVCSEDMQECLLCAAGYNLQRDGCHSDVPLPYGCQIAFNSQMCQLCLPGNYLMFGFQCTENTGLECNIPGCSSCSEANVCNSCIYPLTNDNGVCVENPCPDNCISCDNSTCIQCESGYAVSDGDCLLISYGCSDEMCDFCVNGPEICGNCMEGYYPKFLTDESRQNIGSVCTEITTSMLFDVQAAQNCQTFGLFDPQRPGLYGCVQCVPGFWNVGGYCVANLISDNDIACDSEFCLCTMPNFCNTCQAGYYVREGTGGFCQPKTSLQPNCAWSVYAGECLECNAGFQVYLGACYPIPEASCNMTGCQYCFTEGVCAECQLGFSAVNSGGQISCQADCSVQNCFSCNPEQNNTCDYCNMGYSLVNDNTECVEGADPNYNCSAAPHAKGCATCNAFACFSCLEGYSYISETQSCCQNSPNNNAGCISYNGTCNSECQQCEKGYLLSGGQCYALPCSIQNCAYCFRSESCIVCDEGYTLSNSTGTCEAYTSDCSSNCVTCENGACTECVNGYQIYEGVCVCGFQNCLECVSDYFCTKCAGPSVPAFLEGGGCIPQYTTDILCEIDNCNNCFAINICSKCSQGYTLTLNGTCQINDCSDANCELCSSDQNFCYVCNQGYMPDAFMGKNCVEIPANYSCTLDGCAVCMANDETTCETCNQMYESDGNGGCMKIQCLDNCFFCIESNTCTECSFGFYLTTNNTCQPLPHYPVTPCVDIENCLSCIDLNSDGNVVCNFCTLGFQTSEDQLSCVPQTCNAWKCQICLPGPQATSNLCIICEQGYFLNSYMQCVAYSPEPVTATCGIYNCIYCANNQSCSLCVEGWNETNDECETNLYCGVEYCQTCTTPSNCLDCQPNYDFYQGLCYPHCGINLCTYCTDFDHCESCEAPLILSDDNTECVCKNTYVLVDNVCICPNGTTEFGGSCISCNIDYCNLCEQADICSQCDSNFQVNPNGICKCPTGTTDSEGYCYGCNIDFCNLCMEDGICSECLGELNVVNNGTACNCPNTYEQYQDTCYCPNGTIENNGTCYSCELDYCLLCSEDSVCSQCNETFIVYQGTCICEETSTLYEGMCYTCNITWCTLCQEDDVCATCEAPFVPNMEGNCACPETFELSGNDCICAAGSYNNSGTCTQCTIDYCSQCQSEDICTVCIQPFVNAQNGSCTCPQTYAEHNASCICGEGRTEYNFTCYDCGVDYCDQCSDTDFCNQCQETFHPSANGSCVCNDDTYEISNGTCVCPSETTEYNESCYSCALDYCTLCQEDDVCSTCSAPFVVVNGTCQCRPNFVQTGNTCVCPETYYVHELECLPCNIDFCHQCTSELVCETCDDPFVLNSNATECVCPETFILENGSCVCAAGWILHNDICIECDVNYCNECNETNSCMDCFSTFVLQGDWTCDCPDDTYVIVDSTCTCTNNTVEYQDSCVLCEIDYCIYCTSSNVCGECMDTFINENTSCSCNETQTVYNSSCVSCDISYCALCQQEGVCSACDESFELLEEQNICLCPTTATLFNDYCYDCQIPNCNLCQANGVCSQCLGSLIPTENGTACGCPATYEKVNTTCICPEGTTENDGVCYQCQIQFCVNCLQDNVCSSCKETFSLNSDQNTCVCPTDTTFYNDFCYQCTSPDYCDVCMDDNICYNCTLPFVVNDNNNTCDCPETFIFSGNTCICPSGQFNNSGSCADCPLDYCSQCETLETCKVCQEPFELSPENLCVCPETYTNINDTCVCVDGQSDYNGTCYDCNVTYCVSCSDTNFCHQCAETFNPDQNGSCVCNDDSYEIVSSTCVCPAKTTEYNMSCISCNISYCNLCQQTSQCAQCNLPFVVNDGICSCPTTFIQSGNTCICPTGQYEHAGSCLACTIEYCHACSSATQCTQCESTFILNDNSSACVCEPTYTVQNGSCQCPSNTVEYSGVCYLCNVSFCNYCTADNFCGGCFDTFNTLSNGTCACNDNTYTISNSACSCPTGTIEYQSTCVSCNIAYCTQCQTSGVCFSCATGFTLATGGKSCICPTSFVIINSVCQCPTGFFNTNGVCKSCGVANCLTCNSSTTCGTCKSTFVATSPTLCACPSTYTIQGGLCLCPSGKIEYNSTCIDCNVQYCAVCQQANNCSSCLTTFTLSSNNTCECPSPFVIADNVCGCPVNTTEFNGQCIACNISNCALCQTANVCTNCAESYVASGQGCSCPNGYTAYNNYCYNCAEASNCQICSATNFCQTCAESFTINSTTGTCSCATGTTLYNGTCVGCNVANCGLCRTQDTCFSCNTFYTLQSNYCLLCEIANCSQCSIQNYCSSCSNGLVVNSNGNMCVTCDVENCLECQSNNVCAACSGELQLSASGTNCIVCSAVSGCLTCSTDNICSQCEVGFTLNLDNNTCDVCSFPCQTCVPGSTTCETCAAPYSITPNNGICYTCSVSNCANCSFSNPLFCITCNSGYTNISGLCEVKCKSNLCTACQDVTTCTQCVAGYAPSGNTCVQCSNTPLCVSCSASNVNLCTGCNSGYYLSNSTCLSCPSNCDTCDSTGCLTFKLSTGQFGIRIGNQTVPAVCDAGCKKCSNEAPSKCITCLTGFFLQTDNTCEPCVSPCKTCTSNTNTSCLTCYSNAYLVSGSCQTCTSTSNCLTCQSTNLTACTSCPYGYSLSSGNVCVKGCPSNCLACSNSSICTLCVKGYAPNTNGVCMPCLSTCRECSSLANGVCLSCGSGFYLNTNSVCTVCSAAYCQTCSAIGCSECLPGYTLTTAFTCAKNCKAPCSTCNETSPSVCTSCLAGYTYDSTTNKCAAVTSCPSGCNVCPLGYVLSNLTCLQCSNSSCARCSSSSLSTCTSCYDGMYLSSGMCLTCPTGCDTCSSPINCLSCSSGYTAQVQQVQTNTICVACESPCAQCIGNAQTCSTCMTGYTMVGWKCVTSFNFQVSITFLSNPDVFYTKYQSFIEKITSLVGNANPNQAAVNKIQQGSTEVVVQVNTQAPPNSNEASTQLKDLQDSFKQDSKFEGMKVVSSDVESIGGSVTPIKKKPNLALILGITIPAAIILIAVIGFLIMRSCPSKPPPYSSGVEMSSTNRAVREEFEMTAQIGDNAI